MNPYISSYGYLGGYVDFTSKESKARAAKAATRAGWKHVSPKNRKRTPRPRR